MKTKFLVMFLMVSSAYANGENPFRASAAKAGGGVQGGGGDAKTELRIKEIRDDIFNWINQGGAKGLQFNHGLTLDDYLNGNETKGVYGMKDILISGAVVINAIKSNEQNLSDPELNTHVDGKPKTCKGFISQKDGRPTIICEVERFWELNEQEQYKQIHHEYAGLGLLEKNTGSDSDYSLSNQITKNLKQVTKLMLVVLPEDGLKTPSTCYEKYMSDDFIELAKLKTKRKRQWIVMTRLALITTPAVVVGASVSVSAGIATLMGESTLIGAWEYDAQMSDRQFSNKIGDYNITDPKNYSPDIIQKIEYLPKEAPRSVFASNVYSNNHKAIWAVAWAFHDGITMPPHMFNRLIKTIAKENMSIALTVFENSIVHKHKLVRKKLVKEWISNHYQQYESQAVEWIRKKIRIGVNRGTFCNNRMFLPNDIRFYVNGGYWMEKGY